MPTGAESHTASEEINDGRKRQQQAQAEQRESNGGNAPRGDCPVPPAPFQNPPSEKPGKDGSRGYAGKRPSWFIENEAALDGCRFVPGAGQYRQS